MTAHYYTHDEKRAHLRDVHDALNALIRALDTLDPSIATSWLGQLRPLASRVQAHIDGDFTQEDLEALHDAMVYPIPRPPPHTEGPPDPNAPPWRAQVRALCEVLEQRTERLRHIGEL